MDYNYIIYSYGGIIYSSPWLNAVLLIWWYYFIVVHG